MRFVDLIEKKADGRALTEEEIQEMVTLFNQDEIPSYQMSAMLMAILQKGMSDEEAASLMKAEMYSGETVDLSDVGSMVLDKHSTGGVGDTTSFIVAPLIAACKGKIGMMSGRGLGHTGGTLDKMEAIPGTKVEQSEESFKRIIKKTGLCIIGQTGDLVPADKKLYALRDVTATVRSIPLIAASIMSKKLACGANGIVLDVKTGSGAFMRKEEDAFKLAQLMVNMGTLAGKKVRAVVTDMSEPLGLAVGNALEVKEALKVLSGQVGKGDRLYDVSLMLSRELLKMADLASSDEEAETMLESKIKDGSALAKFQEMFKELGGDAAYVSLDKIDELIKVRKHLVIKAEEDGYISAMDTEGIGIASQLLGAGRATMDDVIDPAVGIMMKVRIGTKVQKGSPLAELYINKEDNLNEATDLLKKSIHIGRKEVGKQKLIYGVVTPSV